MAKGKEKTREERRKEKRELNPTEVAKKIIMFMMFCKKVGLFFQADLFIAFKEFASKKEGWNKFAFLFNMEDKKIKTKIPDPLKLADKTIDAEALATFVEMIPLEEFEEFLTVEAKKVMFEGKEVFAIIFDAEFNIARERLGELEDEEEKKEKPDEKEKEAEAEDSKKD